MVERRSPRSKGRSSKKVGGLIQIKVFRCARATMGRSRTLGREREHAMQTRTSCNSCNSAGCRTCRPGPLGDWSQLDGNHARILGALITEQCHAQGETVFRTGANSGGIYCIAEGIVGLRLLHESGTNVLVDIAYPGDLIGTRAFLRNEIGRAHV